MSVICLKATKMEKVRPDCVSFAQKYSPVTEQL